MLFVIHSVHLTTCSRTQLNGPLTLYNYLITCRRHINIDKSDMCMKAFDTITGTESLSEKEAYTNDIHSPHESNYVSFIHEIFV